MNTNNNSNNIVTTTTTTITTEKSNMNNSINGSNFIVGSPVIAPSSQQQQQQQQQQPQQQQQQPSKANNENSITNAPSNGVAQPPQQQQQQSTVQTIGGQVTSNSNGTATANVIANQLQLANTSNLNNSNNTNNNNNSTSLTNNSMPCSSISGSLASNDEHQQQQQQLHHHHHHHQQSQPHHHNHHHHHNQQQQQQHQHHHQQGGHNEHLSKTNLYIRGLEADATDDYLYNLCSKYGTISSTKAILDRITNSCKGYGFVDFESPQAAEIAVQELLKQGILAQMAKVRPVFTQHHHNQNSMNNSYDQDPTNLYLANLPPHMNEQELENLLSHYGPVVSTRILRDPSNNLPRGVGFARMETRDKCEQIIKHLNGKPCKGGSEPLLVKFADGGIRKRMHHHKIHNDNRWRDSGDIGLSNFDHQPGVSHNNLPNQMMTHGYPRTAHGYPGSVTASPYPAASSAQWLHPSQTGQPYVIPSSVMPTSGLDPSSQAAAALHYVAPMPQLTAQMQSLQLGPHSGQSVGGYLQHQQWAPQQLWAQMQHQQQQQQQQPLQQQTQQQFAQQPPQPGKSQQQSKGNTPSVPGGDWLAVDRS